MYTVAGQADLLLNGQVKRMGPGDAIEIPPLTHHRLTAMTDVDVMEVSTPELDDVVRLEDQYGREGTSAP